MRPRPISLGLLVLVGCAGPQQAVVPEGEPIHLGDAWFQFVAQELGISEDEARAQDERLSEEEPLEEGPLESLAAREAAAVWQETCAPCHGINGDLEGAPELPGHRPRKWDSFGVSMGFFFGGDDMRAGIYRKIRDGVRTEDGQPTIMRAFGGELSRAQIWGLVRHIEGF